MGGSAAAFKNVAGYMLDFGWNMLCFSCRYHVSRFGRYGPKVGTVTKKFWEVLGRYEEVLGSSGQVHAVHVRLFEGSITP